VLLKLADGRMAAAQGNVRAALPNAPHNQFVSLPSVTLTVAASTFAWSSSVGESLYRSQPCAEPMLWAAHRFQNLESGVDVVVEPTKTARP